MIDRVDMFIEVPKVKTQEFKIGEVPASKETSHDVKKRVEAAKKRQLLRFSGKKITSNSEMTTNELNTFCKLDSETEAILKKAVDAMNLSARSYYRILKLARTIADLEASETIEKSHILEALSYRKKD